MDDLELEEWMGLSDGQQDAILEREQRVYFAILNRMTVRQRVDHHRRNALESCLVWRRAMAWFPDLATQYLRDRQVQLLKLRTWRATGIYPGSA